MVTRLVPLTPAAPIGHSALAVPCSHCRAAVGEDCVNITSGDRAPTSHQARWYAFDLAWRTRQMWFLLVADDPRFGLAAGDVLRCVNYPHDKKVTVLFREDDGHAPGCTQYTHAVRFLGFVPYHLEGRAAA